VHAECSKNFVALIIIISRDIKNTGSGCDVVVPRVRLLKRCKKFRNIRSLAASEAVKDVWVYTAFPIQAVQLANQILNI